MKDFSVIKSNCLNVASDFLNARSSVRYLLHDIWTEMEKDDRLHDELIDLFEHLESLYEDSIEIPEDIVNLKTAIADYVSNNVEENDHE